MNYKQHYDQLIKTRKKISLNNIGKKQSIKTIRKRIETIKKNKQLLKNEQDIHM